MKIVAYYRSNKSKTNDRLYQFGEALGAQYSAREDPVVCDLAIQSGFQISPAMEHAMDRGIPIIILENPCWGKDEGTYTWAYNGLNGLGWVPPTPRTPRDKPALEDWMDWSTGETTVFGQVENDKSLRGEDIFRWVDKVRRVLPQASYREHPVMLDQRIWQESYEECLERTTLAVTLSSTVGAQTVIRGIPTIAMHTGSLAYEVSTHNLQDVPITPPREEWLHALSYRHIRDDVPVDYILSGYDEARDMALRGEYDNMSNGRPQ